jgi:hypothetical protein
MNRLLVVVLIAFGLPIFGELLSVANRVPWDFDTGAVIVSLILGLLCLRRWRGLGAILLLYAMVGAYTIIGHLPPKNDPYAPVPAAQPTNTLVIPKKD